MLDYGKRLASLIFGLFLYGLGLVCVIQANIGLAPWEAFGIGVAGVTGLTYGKVYILSGVVIVFIVLLMKEKIGFGTILNTLLIGTFSDLILYLELIPQMDRLIPGILLLLVGEEVVSLGSYFYMKPGLGAGPRDSLMVALGKRLPRVPIGVIRCGIEGTVLLVGYLLGAKVGIGTVIAVLAIGFLLQQTCRILGLDLKGIHHESIFATISTLKERFSKR